MMDIVLLIFGALIILYWGYGMTQQQWDRPFLINKYGIKVFFLGAAILILGVIF